MLFRVRSSEPLPACTSLAGVQGKVLGEALFVLITADHVFGEGGLDRLLAAGEPAVLIEPAPDQPAWAEGTRVRVVDQAVVAFGKHWTSRPSTAARSCSLPRCSTASARQPPKAITAWPVP